MSRIVRKPDFCLREDKGADQLRSDCEADSAFVFATRIHVVQILYVSKLKISSLRSSSVLVQLIRPGRKPRACQNWSETPKTGFLASRLL